VTVNLNYDAAQFPDVSGVAIALVYPSSVSIPGFGSDATVLARVTNLTGVSGGLFNVGDQDTQVNIGLVSLGTSIPAGSFASVRFDCASGASAPAASAFSCSVDASSSLGSEVTAQCALVVTTP
jgi:hypothetical protein